MVMASKKEHGLKDVQRISNSGSKELGGGTTTIKFTLSLLSQRSIHSSSRRIDVVRFIRLLHRAIALLPILQILPNGLAAPLFMPLQPLFTVQPHQFAHRLERPQHRIDPAPVHLVVFQRHGARRPRRRLGIHLPSRLANCNHRREGGGEYRERGHHRDVADDPVEGRYGVEEGELDRGRRWRRQRGSLRQTPPRRTR